MMPAQKTEQYRDELRSSRTEMVQHEDMNMTMHSTITIREDGPYARLTQAWQWLDAQRNDAPDRADIWHVRHRHATDGAYLTDLLHALQSGRYRLSPMQLYGEGENKKAMWGAQDALVLKWVALCIQPLLPLHLSCEHVKGHGGGKQSVGKLHDLLTRTYTGETKHDDSSKKTGGYRWVCRTGIRGYYRHINKERLFAQVRQHVSDPVLRDLVHQYLHYTVEDGGTFHTPETGISRGCALSPLMGALHLYDMDAHFSAQKNIHYARYMDDVIILAKSRWSLRRHTKRLMQWFAEYGFEAHPDKTQIGRTVKGFDWLGAWLTHEGVTDIAPRAKANHREKVRRLYEQLARVPKWLRHRRQQQVHARVSTYRKRWHIWAGALLTVVATSAIADRPIYVLSANLPSGTTLLPGGAFTSSWERVSTMPNLGGSISNPFGAGLQYGTSGVIPCNKVIVNPLTGGFNGTCATIPGTDYVGILLGDNSGLALVATDGYVSLASSKDSAGNAWSAAVRVDPYSPNGLDCEGNIPRSANAAAHLRCIDPSVNASSSDSYLAVASCNGMVASLGQPCPAGTGAMPNAQITSSGTLSFAPYCVNCKPGTVNLGNFAMWMKLGLGGGSLSAPLQKPTAIVVTGLTCNISSDKSKYDVGPVATSAVNEGGGAAYAVLGLTVNCAGANSSGATVPVGVSISPGAGSTRDESSKYILRGDNQPSFYTTFSKKTANCDVSDSSDLVAIGPQFRVPVRTYAPQETGKSDTISLTWALCHSGDITQSPGQYAVNATASIVSF